MDDYYRVPTLVLLGLLVAVFAGLYARRQTHRRLLWLIGWILATVRLALLATHVGDSGIGKAMSESTMMLAAVMFLGSLSPVEFGVRIRISYVIPFSATLLFFAASTALDPRPGPFLHALDVLAAVVTVAAAVDWSRKPHLLPVWFTVLWSVAIGVPCIYLAYIGEYELVLRYAHSGLSIITALLVLAAYRRLSPGVIFTAAGFFVWGLPLLMEMLVPPSDPLWSPAFRLLNLMKVVTALGMILLILEDEARQNEAAQSRDRRARAEMEQYSKLDLSVEPHHDFGIQYSEVCNAVTAAGRFRQAVIFLLDVERNLRVAAVSGIDTELATALDSLGMRISTGEAERSWWQSKPASLETGGVARVDLHPWIQTGDELELQNFTSAYIIPITARSGDLQGILMLAELKENDEPLAPEDMLPLELLVARVAAARESGLLLRRITRSEKLAGIGRLAGGVAHELNNPLTVVMGYAELIQETTAEEKTRRDAAVIRKESQRMKQIIESLARFWKPSPSPVAPIVVQELLAEVESLRRGDYEGKGILLEVIVTPGLPPIYANGNQMRQVLLQMLDNAAAAAAEGPQDVGSRRVRVESTRTANRIQIVISDSGPGFPNPDRVFDPFFTLKPPGEAPALALSLCYSIVREQGGDMSAQNLQPHGAAVVIEMPIEPSHAAPEVSSSLSI